MANLECIVKRNPSDDTCTTGSFYIDGTALYYTLEPPKPIPAGRYRAVSYYSPKHKRKVPRLINIPGHSYVEVHTGNYARDTQNCLLLGMGHGQDMVANSADAIEDFYKRFFECVDNGGECWITYK